MVIGEKRSVSQQLRERRMLSGLRGEGFHALKRAAIRVDEGLSELPRDTQEFPAVLVSDAGRDRNRNYSAQNGGPKSVNEVLVVGKEENQLVAGLCAELLKRMQDAEGTLV